MMKHIIGWSFILASPIVSGMPLWVMIPLDFYHIIPYTDAGPWFVGYLVVWVLLFCLWFDGSKYQECLT